MHLALELGQPLALGRLVRRRLLLLLVAEVEAEVAARRRVDGDVDGVAGFCACANVAAAERENESEERDDAGMRIADIIWSAADEWEARSSVRARCGSRRAKSSRQILAGSMKLLGSAFGMSLRLAGVSMAPMG